MRREKVLVGAFLFVVCITCAARPLCAQQIGKFVPIPANSDADHALTEINAATDPAQKLALIDKFAAIAQGDLAILADDQYVNYYIAAKNYDKAFEYGDKLFALDPDSLSNAVNMVRAAADKGDGDKLLSYGEKTAQILQRYKERPAPEGMKQEAWDTLKAQTLQDVHESVAYVERLVFDGAYRTANAAKRAAFLVRFAQLFPNSPFANQALGVAAASYRQTQNSAKMLEVADGWPRIPTISACCCCWPTITAKRASSWTKRKPTPKNRLRCWTRRKSPMALATSSGNSRAACRRV